MDLLQCRVLVAAVAMGTALAFGGSQAAGAIEPPPTTQTPTQAKMPPARPVPTKVVTDRTFGVWRTQDNSALVRVGPCGALLCGTIEWLLDDPTGDQLVDGRNPNPAMRNRPVRGMKIIEGFRKDAKGWVGGTIYSPQEGRTYKARLSLTNADKLKVEGCVGPFCRAEFWTRSG